MPTATDLDNRPVALGKWPRPPRRFTGHAHAHSASNNALRLRSQEQKRQEHRQWCPLDSCASGGITDILLQPELLNELYGDRGLGSSVSPLLELCLDGGLARKCDSDDSLSDHPLLEKQEALPALLSHCSSCSSIDQDNKKFVATLSQHLRQTGCDIDVQDQQGNSALHLLIKGCSKDNFPTIFGSVKMLLALGPNTGLLTQDADQDSALTLLRVMLDRGLTQASFDLAQELSHNFDVNHMNGHQRTLLTYSVWHGDSALNLTRHLLNRGAQVFPARSSLRRDRSAFTWLVKSVMSLGRLDGHRETLNLLCQSMASRPQAMRSHVLSTMVHLGHSASVMGPLFVQLRALVAPFWTQPLPLLQMCRHTIRQSIGPKNDVAAGVPRLSLPPSLTQYLLLDFH